MSSLQPKSIHPPWNLYTAAKNRLASNQTTDVRTLDQLGRSSSDAIQIRVAENANTSQWTLKLLSKKRSSNVRGAVAQNASTAFSVIEELARDEDADVRFAMAENPRTATALLSLLTQDDNPYVSSRAVRTQMRLQAERNIENGTHQALSGSLEIAKPPHPFILFCRKLCGAAAWPAKKVKPIAVSLADLRAMPKQTQLLIAHSLQDGNSNLTLLDRDSDALTLISAGWLNSVRCTTIGIKCFTIKPEVWRRLRSFKSKFLTKDLRSELECYSKHKSALYPWVW